MKFGLDFIGVQVQVSFAAAAEEADAEAEKFLDTVVVESEDAIGYCVANGRKCFIWVGPEGIRQTVFHECYHATHRILAEIGSGGEDEELNAHLCEYITEKVLTAWEQQS